MQQRVILNNGGIAQQIGQQLVYTNAVAGAAPASNNINLANQFFTVSSTPSASTSFFASRVRA